MYYMYMHIYIKKVAQGFSLSYLKKICATTRSRLCTGRTKVRKDAAIYEILRKYPAQSLM